MQIRRTTRAIRSSLIAAWPRADALKFNVVHSDRCFDRTRCTVLPKPVFLRFPLVAAFD